jgi:hypothetical protein
MDVNDALRLGWLMAEVRGRARPGGPSDVAVSAFQRGEWVLPLASERSAAEREVEAEFALSAVAGRLGVDLPTDEPPEANAPPPAAAIGPRFSAELTRLGKLLADLRGRTDQAHQTEEQQTWRGIARLLYRWDARIQDVLVSRSDRLANAYELGRALAETYWALDIPSAAAPAGGRHPSAGQPDAGQPDAGLPGARQSGGDQSSAGRPGDGPPDQAALPRPDSWEFLLGPERRTDIARLLARLTPYFYPLAAPAVAGSVEVWGMIAASEAWRAAPDARQRLLEQTRNWYSLLVSGLDPETMLKPYALLRSWWIFKKTFRAFGLEMVIGLLGLGLIAALGLLIAYAPHQTTLKAVSAVLGFLGITSASLQARLKATTQSMVSRLSQDLSTDLVAGQITVTPAAPRSVRSKRTMQKAIESRRVTAPLAGSSR